MLSYLKSFLEHLQGLQGICMRLTINSDKLVCAGVKLDNVAIKHGHNFLKSQILVKSPPQALESGERRSDFGVCLDERFKGVDAVGSNLVELC